MSAVPAAAWADAARAAGLATLGRDAAVLEMAYGGDDAAGRRGARRAAPATPTASACWSTRPPRAIELALGKTPPLPPLFEAVRG